MSRERELLLALAVFAVARGHATNCPIALYVDERGHRCACGYSLVRSIAQELATGGAREGGRE